MSRPLTDFKPKWLQPGNWSGTASPFYVGLSFLCPHCDHTDCPTCGHARGQRVAFYFWPPIDPGGLMQAYGENWWPKNGRGRDEHTRVSGETFETLTISPSIGFDTSGHWHGHITNGEVSP